MSTKEPINKAEQLSESEIEKRKSSNRRTLLIIVAISVAPIALAYLSFFTGFGVPSSTASYGQIVNPALNIDVLFENENQDFYADLIENKKWHLFIPVGDICNEECEKNLFVTRQVHVRLGDKSPRVERVLIHLGNASLEEKMEELKQEHPLLRGTAVRKTAWLDLLGQGTKEADPDQQPYYVLVDQEGFIMMRYTSEVEGGNLLKDLKRALKHSIDYQ